MPGMCSTLVVHVCLGAENSGEAALYRTLSKESVLLQQEEGKSYYVSFAVL